ncbi:MAG: BMP family ABC transporter substrate-binding protein [Anaerolineaceae bacterium]|nr:BMP family ABC transporter substrate-binding protein [Anaerolineaceae bacterium]
MKKSILFVSVFFLLALISTAVFAADVKIALVTDTGGIYDQSFNASAWEGMLRAKEELDVEIKYFESRTDADYEPNLRTAVDDGYDLIIAVGWTMADTLQKVAGYYPDQKFAIIDHESVGENVAGINFASEQCSYLVGVAAAVMTETGNVGFITGMVSPLMDTFGVGYYAGVLDTCPDCTIQSFNVNNYDDIEGGEFAALTMFSNGADIVFHAAGGTGMGVIEAAKETGKYAIGVDQDQNYLAQENVLTSALKRVDISVYSLIKNVLDNTFEAGDKLYTLESGAVDIAPTTKLLSEEALAAVETAKAAILSGDIVVPADRKAFAEKYGEGVYTLE